MSKEATSAQARVGENVFHKEHFYRRAGNRFYRALNYLSIYAFIIIVYGGALLTDYFLFMLMAWLLQDDVRRYPLVAIWFDYARIGLALLFIAVAVTHGFISTIEQIKLDIRLSREAERDEAIALHKQ